MVDARVLLPIGSVHVLFDYCLVKCPVRKAVDERHVETFRIEIRTEFLEAVPFEQLGRVSRGQPQSEPKFLPGGQLRPERGRKLPHVGVHRGPVVPRMDVGAVAEMEEAVVIELQSVAFLLYRPEMTGRRHDQVLFPLFISSSITITVV